MPPFPGLVPTLIYNYLNVMQRMPFPQGTVMLRSILAFITHGGHYKSILTYMTSHDSDDGAGFGQTVTRGCSIVGGPEMNWCWTATGRNTGHWLLGTILGIDKLLGTLLGTILPRDTALGSF